MSFCTTPRNAMNSAVVAPMIVTTPSAVSDSSNKGLIRATMKMPAVTIVAAWISAEIGVGPSIESGSQTWSGICALLPIAPTKRQMQMTLSSDHCGLPTRLALGPAFEYSGVIERAEIRENQPDPQHEAEIADTVGEKRFQIGVDRCRPLVPAADQQVRKEAHGFTSAEELGQVCDN